MLRAAGDGLLKALLILGGNGWPEGRGSTVRRSLNSCEFVVLCEVLPSEISRYADVLLPCVTFAETAGTFTSTEHRIQLVRQAVPPQGEARPAWKILSDLACHIRPQRHRHLGDGEHECWTYENTAQIMQEIASLTPLYAGVSHESLERGEPIAW
jgi:predicted molibdopterin-dependent oxidoreductase YjgC